MTVTLLNTTRELSGKTNIPLVLPFHADLCAHTHKQAGKGNSTILHTMTQEWHSSRGSYIADNNNVCFRFLGHSMSVISCWITVHLSQGQC